MKKIDEIEKLALAYIDSLIDGSGDREVVDKWAVDVILNGLCGDFERIRSVNIDLAELIESLPMAITPDQHGGYLFESDDFMSWKEEYLKSQKEPTVT